MNHLEEAIKQAGGTAAIVEAFGYSSAMTISQWRKRGLPADKVIPLSKLGGWVVTPHKLAPTLYPHPHDGLPHDRRSPEALLSRYV